MELEHLINREPIAVKTVKPGETIENVQICPVGDFPNGDRDQHCTLEALENVVAKWKEDGEKEVLVDFEHNSEAGGTSDTSAAAWVTNLRADKERGLVGDFKLTDLGAEAISNRRLRFLSVAWLVNKETREPMVIRSIALTNKPNIPVAPVLNRETSGGINVEEKMKGPTMDKLKEALGLSADATEDQILAAVQEALKAKEEVAELKANAEKAKLEAEAEEFAEKNKAKCDKAVLKAQFIANKEVAQALVAGIPAAKVETVVNKAEAKKPTSFEANKASESDEAILNKYESLSGKAKAEFLEAHALEINRARNAK
jgi:phage I-like protein